jgi:transcriptional regulator with XRE-family HTH domain
MSGPPYNEIAELLEDLPKHVKELRTSRGMSPRAVGKDAGVSYATIYRFEGGRTVSAYSLVQLLRWLGRTS